MGLKKRFSMFLFQHDNHKQNSVTNESIWNMCVEIVYSLYYYHLHVLLMLMLVIVSVV